MSIHDFHKSMHSSRSNDEWLTALRRFNQVDDPQALMAADDDPLVVGWPRWNEEQPD